jgi:hypothetical protein
LRRCPLRVTLDRVSRLRLSAHFRCAQKADLRLGRRPYWFRALEHARIRTLKTDPAVFLLSGNRTAKPPNGEFADLCSPTNTSFRDTADQRKLELRKPPTFGAFSAAIWRRTGPSESARRLAADAVTVERVSTAKFPSNREINREFRRIRALEAILHADTRANSRACGKISYATEQRIFAKEQGILPAKTKIGAG